MKIIVCGGGIVGTGIARQLASEDNDVIIIDESPQTIEKISQSLDVTTVLGFPSHPNRLEEAGARNAEMIIAVTPSDEVNMIICQVAESLFKVPMKIARIRHQNYLMPTWKDLYTHENLPIDYIISPELEVAEAIINRLHTPGALSMMPFADNRLKVVELRCSKTCPVAYQPVGQIMASNPELKMNIIGIVRAEKLIMPTGKDKILPDDSIYVAADTRHIDRVMALFGHLEQEAKRVLIVGGGHIGFNIARDLVEEHEDINIKLIEKSRERAEYVATRLGTAVSILQGSALEQEILDEANISSTEAIISVTNDDEVNILSCLLAKRSGCQRAIALINKATSYDPIIASLGIDVTINPREITVSSVLQHIRRGKVRGAQSICNGKAEIVEIETAEHSSLIGRTIRDLSPPPGVSVFSIVRGDDTIIPEPNTVIAERDRLLIISPVSQIKKVDAIFSARVDYF